MTTIYYFRFIIEISVIVKIGIVIELYYNILYILPTVFYYTLL
jgi:hypothetical protein